MRKRLNEQIISNLHQHGYAADTSFAKIILDNEKIKALQGRKGNFLYAYFQRENAHMDGYMVEDNALYLVCVESDLYGYLLDENYMHNCPLLSQQEITDCFNGLQRILIMPNELAAYRSCNVAKLGRLLQSKQVQTIEKVIFLLLSNRPTDEEAICVSNLYWTVNETKIDCQIWSIEKIYSLLNPQTVPEEVLLSEPQVAKTIIFDENLMASLHELCLRTNGITDENDLQRELFRLGSPKLQQLADCLQAYADTTAEFNPELLGTINRLNEATMPPELDFWPNGNESAIIISLVDKLLKNLHRSLPGKI